MRKRKLLLITSLALAGSLCSHAKLYAKIQKPPLELPKRVIRIGKASWYSKKSPGIRKRTANNEIFDDTAMTAAMWGVPFHQLIRVTNVDNGKSIIVRVNDRGPHRRYVQRGRLIDLSRRAFTELSPTRKGLINVEIELL